MEKERRPDWFNPQGPGLDLPEEQEGTLDYEEEERKAFKPWEELLRQVSLCYGGEGQTKSCEKQEEEKRMKLPKLLRPNTQKLKEFICLVFGHDDVVLSHVNNGVAYGYCRCFRCGREQLLVVRLWKKDKEVPRV